MSKFFLIDAMALIYRAYFAFIRVPMVNSKKINTGCIFGFTNALLEILTKEKPSHIVVAFDLYEPTFRQVEYSEYKANRPPQPEDISKAIPIIKDIIRAFNIPIVELAGYEADDIIGTIVSKIAPKTSNIYIVTPDKDLGQLIVDDNIFMYIPKTRIKPTTILGTKEILKKWDIQDVKQITDIIGLWGDASDNIPGVPGIGEKTAAKIIKEFGSLEEAINNVDKIKGKVGKNLFEYAEQALYSKKLGTIYTDVPLEFDEEEAKYTNFHKNKLLLLFEDLEFGSIIRRLFPDKSLSKNNVQKNLFEPSRDGFITQVSSIHKSEKQNFTEEISKLNVKVIIDDKELDDAIKVLSGVDKISVHTRRSHKNPHNAKLLGIAISTATDAFYIPYISMNEILNKKLNDILGDDKVLKIGAYIKYNIVLLARNNIRLRGPFFDVSIASYILNPQVGIDLASLSKFYLNYELPISEALTTLSSPSNPSDNSSHAKYKLDYKNIAKQTHIIIYIYSKLQNLAKEAHNDALFQNIEMPLIEVLATIELNGVSIDTDYLKKLSKDFTEDLQILESKIYKISGEKFNINSPKQLGIILFDKLKLLENPPKTKSGQYSTGEAILNQIIDKNKKSNKDTILVTNEKFSKCLEETIIKGDLSSNFKYFWYIAQYLIDYKMMAKLLSTYVNALPKIVGNTDKRIHTTFNQTGVSTGRLSSTDPNLQNIPIRTEQGKKIRKAFVPQNFDFRILSADYSQIELRLMASFANDKHMIEAFKNNLDIHKITASKIFKIKEKDITKEMRYQAKAVNFGIIYGISAFGLAKILKIPRGDASEIIKAYFYEFTGIKDYMEDIVEKAKQQGFVTTIFGRKRFLPNINSKNATIRKYDERNAINSPLQGSQAEIIKIAMINIQKWLKNNPALKSKMILQIHDELVFEVHKEEIDIVRKNVISMMESAGTVEADTGTNRTNTGAADYASFLDKTDSKFDKIESSNKRDCIPLKVPLKVNVSIGPNWLEIE